MDKKYSIACFELEDGTDITDKIDRDSFGYINVRESVMGSDQEILSNAVTLRYVRINFKSKKVDFKEGQTIRVLFKSLKNPLNLKIVNVVDTDVKNSVLLNINRRLK